MLKKLLLPLLLAPALFSSCGKQPDSIGVDYVVNGIHDADLSKPGGGQIALSVNQVSGSQEMVGLSLSGLPAGITADISPKNGIPAFSALLSFTSDGSAAQGSYPVKLTAASKSLSRSYNFNVLVPPRNDWKIGNTPYQVQEITMDQHNFTARSDNNYITLQFYAGVPATGGTYRITAMPAANDELSIIANVGNAVVYKSTGAGNKTVTVTVSNGKRTATFSDVPARDLLGAGPDVLLSGSIHE